MSSSIATIDPGVIDSNRWYALWIAEHENRTLGIWSTYKPGGKTGPITNEVRSPSEVRQRWQIYPLNATTYVLRNQLGGANSFLGAYFEPKETAEGQTRPRLVRGDIADGTVYWTFGKWGDGTYWLSNAANTTKWHYDIAPGGAMKMSPDITAPQANQRWEFEPVAVIDDPTYSSVNLLGATVTSPNTATTSLPSSTPTSSSPDPASSNTSSSTSSDTPSSSSGLSTAAKAGIGAGVGGVALIALVLLGLFLYRRRKARPAPHSTAYEPYQSPASSEHMTQQPPTDHVIGKHELYHDDSAAKYEMPAPAMAEVEAHGRPVELPGAPIAGGR